MAHITLNNKDNKNGRMLSKTCLKFVFVFKILNEMVILFLWCIWGKMFHNLSNELWNNFLAKIKLHRKTFSKYLVKPEPRDLSRNIWVFETHYVPKHILVVQKNGKKNRFRLLPPSSYQQNVVENSTYISISEFLLFLNTYFPGFILQIIRGFCDLHRCT